MCRPPHKYRSLIYGIIRDLAGRGGRWKHRVTGHAALLCLQTNNTVCLEEANARSGPGEKQDGQGLKVAAAYQERGSYVYWGKKWTEGEVTLGYSVTLALAIAPRQPNVPLPGYKWHPAARTRAWIELYLLLRFFLVCLFPCFIEWRGEKAFKLFFFLLYAVHLSSWRWPTKY